MPQLALKANEISSELIDILASKTQISEMQYYRYLKDIEKLRDSSSEDYLKALANGAYGKKDAAVAFFEEAAKQGGELVAQNYIVYLSDYGTYREVQDVVNRFAGRYISRTMFGHAWETNLFMGDIDAALYFAERLISIADEKEAEMVTDRAASALAQTTQFKQFSGVSDDEFKDIANRVVDVMDSHGVSPVALSFFSIPEEQTSSYVMTVDTVDPDVLSDMNLDIAFSLAENDSLIGKPFSVWFEGSQEDTQRACI